jgi:hypothetical protein
MVSIILRKGTVRISVNIEEEDILSVEEASWRSIYVTDLPDCSRCLGEKTGEGSSGNQARWRTASADAILEVTTEPADTVTLLDATANSTL